jgi:uncharacterized protein (TIGR02453 family)
MSNTFKPLNLALDFLAELRNHNEKAWFDQNRPAYEAARGAFEALVDDLISEFREIDNLQDLSAKDCIFRINRDLRFTKDKSPYKTNLAALIAPGGRKSSTLKGYYLSIEPQGHSMIAGGLYDPSTVQLNRFRHAIARDAGEFKEIVGKPSFKELFGNVQGESLKTAPQGYDPSHPEIDLLRLKQITVLRHFSDAEVIDQDFAGRLFEMCREMKPFLAYLDGVISGQ